MTQLERLLKHFQQFPGIGPRQARRFVDHLLRSEPADVTDLSKAIAELQSDVSECTTCRRFFSKQSNSQIECSTCSDKTRDHTKLLIVERDVDIDSVARSGTYDGYYFVLGGTVPLLNSEDTKKLRGGALKKIVGTKLSDGLEEIILAFSVNPDGENTARYVESLIKDLPSIDTVKISILGRGLSTGSELEYADPDTIKNALRNRS